MPTLLHYSDVENAFDRPERVARLAAALQTPADAIVVGSGDVLAPGALANEHEGRQALPFFRVGEPNIWNALSAVADENHEGLYQEPVEGARIAYSSARSTTS